MTTNILNNLKQSTQPIWLALSTETEQSQWTSRQWIWIGIGLVAVVVITAAVLSVRADFVRYFKISRM